MSESCFKAKIVKQLRDLGSIVINNHQTERSTYGTPDITLIHWKVRSFLEFKGVETKLEPHQKKMIYEMRRRGMKAFVIRESLDLVLGYIEDEEDKTLEYFYDAKELLEELAAIPFK